MGFIQLMERVIGTTFTSKPVSQRMGVVSFGYGSERRYDKKPHELMRDALNAYESRPFVHSGVNQLALLITGGHLSVKGSEKTDVDKIQKWIDYRKHVHEEVNLLTKLFLVTGNVPVEKAFVMKNEKFYVDDFYVFPRPDRFFRTLYVYDKDGNYVDDDDRYWLIEVDKASRGLLVDGKSMNPQMFRIAYSPYAIAPVEVIYAIPFHKNKFCYLRTAYKKWFFYSYSFVMSSLDDIDAMYNIIQNIIGISKYKAIGKQIINIGDEKDPATPEDINNLKSDLQAGTFKNIVLNKKVNKTSLSYEGDYNTMTGEMDFLRKEVGSGLTPNYLTPWNSEVNRACSLLSVTKVLSENRGWIFHEDVQDGEKIALYNPETDMMEFKIPKKLHIYDIKEEELCVSDSRIAKYIVTPEHTLLTKTDKRVSYQSKKAHEVHNYEKLIFKTAALFPGSEIKKINLPSVNILGYNTEELALNADDMIAFTGLFLSEGCINQPDNDNNSSISISQSENINPEKVLKIDKLMDRLPFNIFRSKDDKGIIRWLFNNKQMKKWLSDNCGIRSHTKKIPRELLRVSIRQRKILYDWLMLGDGTTYSILAEKNNIKNRYKYSIGSYTTISKQLADDMQELCISLGYSAIINLAYKAEGNRKDCWRIHISSNIDRSSNKSERYLKKFTGKVGCFETDTGFYFIKVGDTVHVSGNTSAEVKIVLEKQLQVWRRGILEFLNDNILDSVKEMLGITSDVEFDFPELDLYTTEEKQSVISPMYQDNLVTANEYRSKMGLDAIEGGDVFKTEFEKSMGVLDKDYDPAGSMFPTEGMKLKEEMKKQVRVNGHVVSLEQIGHTWQVLDGSEIKISIDDEQTARTFMQNYVKKIRDNDTPLSETDYKDEEEEMTKELTDTVKNLKDEVSSLLSSHTENFKEGKLINTDIIPKIDDLFDKAFGGLRKKFKKTIGDVFGSSKTSVLSAVTAATLGTGKQAPDTSKIQNIDMKDLKLDAVEQTYQQDLKNLKNQKVAQLSRMVADAAATGMSSGKIKQQVLNAVGDVHHEAERILRTNINRTSTMSKLLMYQKMGIKKFQWLAHIDERTRKTHKKRNGKVFSVDKALKGLDPAPTMVRDSSGKWLPAENINCRCGIRLYFT